MSITRTPHNPVCAAKATFKIPTASSVCMRVIPNSTLAILHAARFTEAMIMQLKNNPRYSARNPRTAVAAFPEYRNS